MGLLNAILGRDNPPDEVIQDCNSRITEMLNRSPLKENEDWVDTEDGFLFQRGSATIKMQFVVDDDEIPHIQMFSPIVKLPPDNLLVFYRHLLELNFIRSKVAIGIEGDTVFVCADRSIESLTEEGLEEVMEEVSGAADELDDYLHDKFGAPFFESEEQ